MCNTYQPEKLFVLSERTLIWALIDLQILDMITTAYAISHGLSEANPFMVGIVGNTALFIAVKATGVFVLIATNRIMNMLSDHKNIPLYASIAVTGIVVINNIYQIMR